MKNLSKMNFTKTSINNGLDEKGIDYLEKEYSYK